jgi:hypothetical protein
MGLIGQFFKFSFVGGQKGTQTIVRARTGSLRLNAGSVLCFRHGLLWAIRNCALVSLWKHNATERITFPKRLIIHKRQFIAVHYLDMYGL